MWFIAFDYLGEIHHDMIGRYKAEPVYHYGDTYLNDLYGVKISLSLFLSIGTFIFS